MALATLASINERNGIDLRDIMERFLDWEFHGAYTPFGKAFDEGNTCSNASISIATATTSQPAAKRMNIPTAMAH